MPESNGVASAPGERSLRNAAVLVAVPKSGEKFGVFQKICITTNRVLESRQKTILANFSENKIPNSDTISGRCDRAKSAVRCRLGGRPALSLVDVRDCFSLSAEANDVQTQVMRITIGPMMEDLRINTCCIGAALHMPLGGLCNAAAGLSAHTADRPACAGARWAQRMQTECTASQFVCTSSDRSRGSERACV